MTHFNYKSPGEFYCQKNKGIGSGIGLTYRRFDTGAEAIRFAMEQVPSSTLGTCTLEVDGERFGAKELRELYESSRYPLPRGKRRRNGRSTD